MGRGMGRGVWLCGLEPQPRLGREVTQDHPGREAGFKHSKGGWQGSKGNTGQWGSPTGSTRAQQESQQAGKAEHEDAHRKCPRRWVGVTHRQTKPEKTSAAPGPGPAVPHVLLASLATPCFLHPSLSRNSYAAGIVQHIVLCAFMYHSPPHFFIF